MATGSKPKKSRVDYRNGFHDALLMMLGRDDWTTLETGDMGHVYAFFNKKTGETKVFGDRKRVKTATELLLGSREQVRSFKRAGDARF